MPSQEGAGTGVGRGGVLVVDKPAGPTSHDIVAVVRRRCGRAKVGHAGTLDPMATGVLPLLVGRATRLARYLSGPDKEYRAVVRLGRTTDTLDSAGRTVSEAPAGTPMPAADAVAGLLPSFLGTWLQTPPAFSAKMVGGVRAYEHARLGKTVTLAPVPVTVTDIEFVALEGPLLTVRVVASSGFYVRAFAGDLGSRLGVGACLDALRRTRSGAFRVEDAVGLERVLDSDLGTLLLPLEGLLLDWPSAALTAEGLERVGHGRGIGPGHYRMSAGGRPGEPVRLLGPDGRLAGIGEPAADGLLRPALVLE